MAPIRRYLRISETSVLEVRIYLDKPSLSSSWLLRDRDPILPKVIEAVRPLVLPKLREENEKDRSRGPLKKKPKSVKDVVVQDEFSISMFLKPTPTRHALLTKHKRFRDPKKKPLTSTASKLTDLGISDDVAIPIVDEVDENPFIPEEEDDEDGIISRMQEIPSYPASEEEQDDEEDFQEHQKRGRKDDDGLFVNSRENKTSKRLKVISDADLEGDDDKKKLGMDVSYDGFAIWGRVLCLIVTKRDTKPGNSASGAGSIIPENVNSGGGRALMEEWIVSTQVPPGEEDD